MNIGSRIETFDVVPVDPLAAPLEEELEVPEPAEVPVPAAAAR